MKSDKILNVDSIGSEEGLTKEEEIALSEFFNKRKSIIRKTTTKRKTRSTKDKA